VLKSRIPRRENINVAQVCRPPRPLWRAASSCDPVLSGLISSIVATLNRTTVTSDALTSLYDLVRALSLQLGVFCTLWSLVLIVIIIFLKSFFVIIIFSSPQLHSVLAGKDYIQEPFLSEGGAAALLHAMCVHHPCHCLTPIRHSHHHRNCLQHGDHLSCLFSGQSFRNLPVSPRALTCCVTAAAACTPVASSAIQARCKCVRTQAIT
jgi:hypothetical protein